MLRVPGRLYTSHEAGMISNLYNFKLLNKSQSTIPIEFKLLSTEGDIKVVGNNDVYVKKEESVDGTLFIYIDKENLKSIKTKIKVGVYQDGKLIDKVKTTFNGPIKEL